MKFCSTIIFIIYFLLDPGQAGAQGSSYDVQQGKTPLAATITFSDETEDWSPFLLNIRPEAPRPGSNYYERKKEINEKRFSMQHKPAVILYKANAPAPQLSKNFNANIAQGTPNDNNFSIGNSGRMISVVNTNIYLYNDTGTQLSSKSLAAFASKLGFLNRTYDPKTIYDPIADRFIVVFMNGTESINTNIIVGFSQSSNPAGVWNFYKLPGNNLNDTTWSDYPVIAISEKELFITVNLLKDNTNWKDGFRQSIIWQLDKSKGYAGDSLDQRFYSNIKYNNKPVWSICPVQGGMKPQGPATYLLSVRPGDVQNDSLFLHTISNTIASGNASLSIKLLRTDKMYGLPPSAMQPDSQWLETNDARVLSGFVENDRIQFVNTTIDTNSYNSAVFHGVIDLLQPNAVVSCQIISSDTLDIAYPSIAYAGGGASDNSAMITFSHVFTKTFPGTSAIFLDRDHNPSPILRVKNGLNSINVLLDSNERWGDYTGIQRKYNESGVVWLSGSYGTVASTHHTWIARLISKDPALGTPRTEERNSAAFPSDLYPNPSSYFTTVDFELQARERLQFSVYDISGKLIKTLYQDNATPGLNRFTFSTEPLQPGLYYLQIANDREIKSVKKFVVAR